MKKYSVLRFPGFKEKAVTLSYDDSPIYDRKLIEIMDKNGLKGTFNINSGRFVNPGEIYLTKEEALELYKDSGHEVAVHGRNHLYLPDIDTAMVVDDIINDRIALEEMFGGVITGMAYAYGAYNDSVVDVLKMCGIEYARTINATESFEQLDANMTQLITDVQSVDEQISGLTVANNKIVENIVQLSALTEEVSASAGEMGNLTDSSKNLAEQVKGSVEHIKDRTDSLKEFM